MEVIKKLLLGILLERGEHDYNDLFLFGFKRRGGFSRFYCYNLCYLRYCFIYYLRIYREKISMKDLFKKIKDSEKNPDMSSSRSKREFIKDIRRTNSGISLFLDLLIFLGLVFILGKVFGWW